MPCFLMQRTWITAKAKTDLIRRRGAILIPASFLEFLKSIGESVWLFPNMGGPEYRPQNAGILTRGTCKKDS